VEMQAKQTEAPVVTWYSLIAAWPGRNGGSATTGSGGDALGANCSTGGTGGPALEEMQAKGVFLMEGQRATAIMVARDQTAVSTAYFKWLDKNKQMA
jgi:hypothetical protein